MHTERNQRKKRPYWVYTKQEVSAFGIEEVFQKADSDGLVAILEEEVISDLIPHGKPWTVYEHLGMWNMETVQPILRAASVEYNRLESEAAEEN